MVKKVSPLQQTLNVWAVILIIWSLYRAYFQTDLPVWADELIAKPLVFILPVFYYITKVEKTNFFSGTSLSLKNIKINILLGVLIGLIFFIGAGLGFFVRSKDFLPLINRLLDYQLILYFLPIALATSISEEVLSRGFVLKRLFGDSKNAIASSFFGSILFLFLHIPILLTNDRIVGTVLLRVLFMDFVLSMAVSLIYLERKNLVPPILIHAFYNLSFYILGYS